MKRTQEWFERQIMPRLKELGGGPKVVAASLAAMKIKGVPCDADECPVAKVVKKWFRSASMVVVDMADITVGWKADGRSEVGDSFSVKPPAAVANFIDQFDGGKFPAMIDEKATAAFSTAYTDHILGTTEVGNGGAVKKKSKAKAKKAK